MLAGSTGAVRSLHEMGCRLDLVAKNHTTLVDNALLLHDPDSVNRMIVTLIELKSPIHFRAVNLCIGANQPALMASAEKLMRAVIEQGLRGIAGGSEGDNDENECIRSWHMRYIQQHFPLDVAMRLFDDCVLWSHSPIWAASPSPWYWRRLRVVR